MNVMLRGLPFIYQGQEIGMENVEFQSISEVDDISTLDEYQVALDAGLTPDAALKAVSRVSRDNARTPMQWDDSAQAGFTTGTPWLFVNPNYKEINVKEQLGREDSVWYYYQKLIALRKSEDYKEVFTYGKVVPMFVEKDGIFAYARKTEDQTVYIITNYSREDITVDLLTTNEQPKLHVLLDNKNDVCLNGNRIRLSSGQAVILG